jgi:hypothetical protein
MKRSKSDSKFIIYQVLYIFVITVLAMKGADLDLTPVISKNNAVSKSVKDSLIVVIDSLYAQGKKFQIKVDTTSEIQNAVLKAKLLSLNRQLASLKPAEKILQPPQQKENPVAPVKKEQSVIQSPISIKQTFLQNTWNTATNSGNVNAAIYAPDNLKNPIVIIPPNQTKKFDLNNEKQVILKYGDQQQALNVLPMNPPQIKIDKATTKMDASTIYVRELQQVTDFKVTIKYDRPDQLKITYTGPISVSGPFKNNNGDLVYDVSLKLASNNQQYQDWLDRNSNMRDADGRYKTNFFFTAVDKRSKVRVVVGDSFYFTDFEK